MAFGAAGRRPGDRPRSAVELVAAAAAVALLFVGARSALARRAGVPALGGGGAPPPDGCHAERGVEYGGEGYEAVRSGAGGAWPLHLGSPEACCEACASEARCNAWAFCDAWSGCVHADAGAHVERGGCWLLRGAAKALDLLAPGGARDPAGGWVSGLALGPGLAAARRRLADAAAAPSEAAYLAALRSDAALSIVFFDVEIGGRPAGRIEMALFPDAAPRAAENFRRLATGEAGPAGAGREGAGAPRHFRGAPFYRIIDRFIDQAGVEVESALPGGGQFRDDAGGLALRHVRKGLLSMANMGPNTNTAHFSIMAAPAPHLDGAYTIFGQVVAGLDVVDAVNALAKGQPDNTATAAAGARIADCGELRRGTFVPDLEQDA